MQNFVLTLLLLEYGFGDAKLCELNYQDEVLTLLLLEYGFGVSLCRVCG